MWRPGALADHRSMNRGIHRLVISALVVAAAVLAPSGATTAPAAGTPRLAAASLTLSVNNILENTIVVLTNTKRVLAGCPPLRTNGDLRQAARAHAKRMATTGVMSHRLAGEPTLGRRITLAGYTGWSRVAENIAAGYTSATLVLRAWWNSYTHRRNLLDCSLREVGVGVVWTGRTMYWTQDFGRR